MMAGIGVFGDADLITRWWLPIEAAGFQVDVRPPLNKPCDPDSDGRVYRGGFVRNGSTAVRIVTTSALFPRSAHALSGKPALFVQYGAFFRKTQELKRALAEDVINVLVRSGLQRLGRPSDY